MDNFYDDNFDQDDPNLLDGIFGVDHQVNEADLLDILEIANNSQVLQYQEPAMEDRNSQRTEFFLTTGEDGVYLTISEQFIPDDNQIMIDPQAGPSTNEQEQTLSASLDEIEIGDLRPERGGGPRDLSPNLPEVESQFGFEDSQEISHELDDDSAPSIDQFNGKYNFSVRPLEESNKKRCLYHRLTNKIYCSQGVPISFQFLIDYDKIHKKLGKFQIISKMVFTDQTYRRLPVLRCVQHREGDVQQGKTKENFVWTSCEKDSLHYQNMDTRRCYVMDPFDQNQTGKDKLKMVLVKNYKFNCLGSCKIVGSKKDLQIDGAGINRRETTIVFTLTENNKVVGRSSIHVKICTCPNRDFEKDHQVLKKNDSMNETIGRKRKRNVNVKTEDEPQPSTSNGTGIDASRIVKEEDSSPKKKSYDSPANKKIADEAVANHRHILNKRIQSSFCDPEVNNEKEDDELKKSSQDSIDSEISFSQTSCDEASLSEESRKTLYKVIAILRHEDSRNKEVKDIANTTATVISQNFRTIRFYRRYSKSKARLERVKEEENVPEDGSPDSGVGGNQ